jgi:phosphatidate cytidylyltransferase
MLRQRLATALTGIVLVLFFLWLGNLPLTAFISLIALLAALELAKVFSFKPATKYWLCFFALITPLAVYFFTLSLLGLGIIFLLGLLFLRGTKRIKNDQLSLAVFSYLYIPGLLSFAVFLLQKPVGNILILLVLIATWLTDTLAYFVGSLFGRHKLAPNISPNKTNK